MKGYYKTDEWRIIEEGFNPEMQEASESIFSLGNGRMGQRANFEERYSGETLQGTYIAGVYYPDKTRVGWWKNGYPEYFAKVLNAPGWIGINVFIDGEELDLSRFRIEGFRRELNMKQGYLERTFEAVCENDKKVRVNAKRFLSMKEDEIGAIRYEVTLLNAPGTIMFVPHLDGNVRNRDSNYGEKFWTMEERDASEGSAHLVAKTRKSGFIACMAMRYEVKADGKVIRVIPEVTRKEDYVANTVSVDAEKDTSVVFYKYVSVLSSLNHERSVIVNNANQLADKALKKGFDKLFDEHAAIWEQNWAHSDIVVEGDTVAQQGIRFNIFQLNQTYTGRDERLNIGPKGFTGEKYGGSTYWDTEAYLIPFFLSTAPVEVARNLLIYRFKHLEKAIENAGKLGFKDGAALYPMVTMNGEECHNEWEITFEEIHRNGAIAYAIHNYINYTGDRDYLSEYGLEVLMAISRFWRQRVNWSDVRGKYVMLGVTGPNEYENNVNNNWYTNKIAVWTLKYTIEAIQYVSRHHPERYQEIVKKWDFNADRETADWIDIIDNMHFPHNEVKDVFLQQDGYMDKKQILAADLDPSERPINQHWSWDRILRSTLIKQADVLQGIYFFEEEYDPDTIRRNFDFYELRTVHESSLSPCVHSILASKLGRNKLAYELYLRTSRLDLDDYNREVSEGLHITSMGGTWMSIVYGFGGMRVIKGELHFNPLLPDKWESLSFKIMFRGRTLRVHIAKEGVSITNESEEALELYIYGERMKVKGKGEVWVKGRISE
ncbi:MAG: glycoside hydrolase family 65 protein [Bacteroidales bacterium]|nr:glycoside hydrolase family 65 protein [Bacteroidales bacterium]MBN2699036.1 glycoside hydrolase family 65 protein [Bacteroidales bacterium]